MPKNANEPSDAPDDLSPEWTAAQSAWAVKAADFANPIEATKFLLRRERIFRAAATAGMTTDMLRPFEPNKPGFEARIEAAFRHVAGAAE